MDQPLGLFRQDVVPNSVSMWEHSDGLSAGCRWEAIAGVPGLSMMHDLVSPEEEKQLLAAIAAEEWTTNREDPPRKVQIFGARRVGSVFPRHQSSKFPPWWSFVLAKRLRATLMARASTEEVFFRYVSKLEDPETGLLFVNEYTRKTQELAFHIDNPKLFDDVIVGVSLSASCTFSFAPATAEGKIVDVLLPPRSVYVMTGAARYDFRHGLRRDSLKGARRISLTFRTVRDNVLVD